MYDLFFRYEDLADESARETEVSRIIHFLSLPPSVTERALERAKELSEEDEQIVIASKKKKKKKKKKQNLSSKEDKFRFSSAGYWSTRRARGFRHDRWKETLPRDVLEKLQVRTLVW